jgi:hypothetical protein
MLRRTVVMTALSLVSLVTPAAQQQVVQPTPSTTPPTGVLAGQTVDGTTGKSVSSTIVTLAGGPVPLRVIADGEGRFVFHSLPKGTYSITASKLGYTDGAYGRRIPEAGPILQIVLADGERKGGHTVAVWKHAAIGGRVVDEAGEPVIGQPVRVFRRAIVAGRTLLGSAGNQGVTDDRGEYRVASLTPGDYVVAVATTQATVPLSLQDAHRQASKAGTGQEFDRELDRSSGGLGTGFGSNTGGQRVGDFLIPSRPPIIATGVTAPPVEGEKVFVYPTVFYPASNVPSRATVISLDSGQQRSGVDFSLAPVRTARVSGELLGPTGPEVHTALQLVPAGAEELARDADFTSVVTYSDAAGRFTFLGVTPGQYRLRVLKIPPRPVTSASSATFIRTGSTTIMSGGSATPPTVSKDPTFWAELPVSVGESDVTGLSVAMRSGARISGSVVFEGTAEKPQADRLIAMSIQVDSANGRTTSMNQFTLSRGAVDASGQFTTYQQAAGRYTLRVVTVLPGWTFKSAVVNGVDISDTPIELGAEDVTGVVLTFTDTPTALSGTVRNAQGVGEQMAAVLIFPADPRGWTDFGSVPRRLRLVRPGVGGAYQTTGLPAGDYLVAAVEPGRAVNWQTPAVLKTLVADATRVTLSDAEKRIVDLKVSVLR